VYLVLKFQKDYYTYVFVDLKPILCVKFKNEKDIIMKNKLRTKVIGVRVKEEASDLVEKVCEARGEYISDFVRRAILKELAGLSFFDEESKKALGI